MLLSEELIVIPFFLRAPMQSTPTRDRQAVLSMQSTNTSPLLLSMDWLNNKLYILIEIEYKVSVGAGWKRNCRGLTKGFLSQYYKMWQISRCDFDGRSLTVVYAGLRDKPAHFEVDPFNG